MPIVPVVLYGSKDHMVKTEAYVDSGAVCSIFNLSLLKGLGLKKDTGKHRMFVVGDGSFIPGYVFKISIEIGDIKFISDIAFSDRLGVGFNLLGRLKVFGQFDEVVFMEKRREIEFRIYNRE